MRARPSDVIDVFVYVVVLNLAIEYVPAVISEGFTLSLLTAQQFQRTASTITACEYLRRKDPSRLGDEPVSVGLWVGEPTTPNRFVQAREQFDELRDAGETDDRFLLDRELIVAHFEVA